MDPSRTILLAFITVLCIGSTNVYSQETNSSGLICSGAKNCQTCVQDFSCFWCESQLLCKVYSKKSKEEETKGCGEWRWKSCQKPDGQLIAILSGCASVVLICVLVVLVCIKRDLWNRMKTSRFCDRWDREGLFEQEERGNRKRKHKKKQSNKAQKLTEKYQLSDTSAFLYSP
ncbi:hypothetical protein OS493_014251 [Desmophyllum pertusum]|uniref:PSI domain-containing protein n=1 Tax=Desmophyllum pertusum TaxID=174260 RepID=A0A9W9Z3L4_9CNID|nr:hypothetical protein OS493_014251 [Desmophyllum pertusum]